MFEQIDFREAFPGIHLEDRADMAISPEPVDGMYAGFLVVDTGAGRVCSNVSIAKEMLESVDAGKLIAYLVERLACRSR